MKIKDLFESQPSNYNAFKRNFRYAVEGNLLWRGVTPDGSWNTINDGDVKIRIRYVPAKKTIRDTQYHDSLMYEASSWLPGWDKVPPRRKSVICSTEESLADRFGTPFLLIPADNVKTFAWLKDDFNMMKGSTDEWETVYSILLIIQRRLRIIPESLEEALEAAEKIDEAIKNGDIAKSDVEWLNGRSCVEVLKDFTPENAGVELFNSVKDLPKSYGKTPEVWFEGDHLLIDLRSMIDGAHDESLLDVIDSIYEALFEDD